MYIVLFTANHSRTTPIRSHYRPDWCSDSKPEYNCAQLLFDDIQDINPGESHYCTLQPMRPDLWDKVMINDTLRCMEGSRQVGEALILKIIE